MKDPFNVSAEDELLLARCLKKEESALAELISVYGESFYGFLRSALGKRAALTHSFLTASFVELLRLPSAFNLTEPLRVILMRNLLTLVQKNLKQKHSEGPLPGLSKRLSVLFHCLSCLTWEDRVFLLLRDQMDFSLQEIQVVLSKTEQEVRVQIQEARLHFREELQKILKDKKTLLS